MLKKTLILLTVSGVLLAVLFSKVDFARMWQTFLNVQPEYIAWYLFTYVFVYLFSSLRWQVIARSHYRSISLFECFRQIAATSAINVVVPSKLGTLGKAYFLYKEDPSSKAIPVSMVVYEKQSETFGMCVAILISLAFSSLDNVVIYPVSLLAMGFILFFAVLHFGKVMPTILKHFNPKRKITTKLYNLATTLDRYCRDPEVTLQRRLAANLLTIVLWVFHCTQFWLFFKMLGLSMNPADCVLGVCCGIVVGLIPVSLAGIGPREATLVYMFQGRLSIEQSMTLGVLFLSRYVIPSLLGLAFVLFKVIDIKSLKKEVALTDPPA